MEYLLKFLTVSLLFSVSPLNSARAEEGGGGNASDPTASVNYVDVRFQAGELDGDGQLERSAGCERGFHPRHALGLRARDVDLQQAEAFLEGGKGRRIGKSDCGVERLAPFEYPLDLSVLALHRIARR